jgi:hypothetical protein
MKVYISEVMLAFGSEAPIKVKCLCNLKSMLNEPAFGF